MSTDAARRIREIAQTLRSLKAEPGDRDPMVVELLATADSLDARKTKFERKIVIKRRWEDDADFARRWINTSVQGPDPDFIMDAWRKQIRLEFDEPIWGGEVSAEKTVLDFHSVECVEYGDWRFYATLRFFYNEPGWRAAHAKAREDNSYYSDRPFDEWLVHAVFGGDEGCVGGGWAFVGGE